MHCLSMLFVCLVLFDDASSVWRWIMSDIFILYVAFSYLYVAFSVFKIRDKIKIKHFIVLFLPAPMTLPWVLVTEYNSVWRSFWSV